MKLTENDIVKGSQVTEKFMEEYPEFRQLRDKLRTIDGSELLLLHGIRLKEIIDCLEKGKCFSGDIVNIKGLKNECFYNCAIFAKSNPHYQIIYGWALFDDIWILHSWLTTDGELIIETTFCFDAYYGYILNEKEKKYFISRYINEYKNRMSNK